MTPEEFRAAGHQLIDWIADQRAAVADRPVLAQVEPGQVRAGLPSEPPSEPGSMLELLEDLDRVIVPGITQVQHPMHFGWFPSNAALASVLGDIASSGLGTLGISWESCPSLTEVEEVVCDWMRQLAGLSEAWVGAIHDTASTACLTSLLVARERATGMAQNSGGLQAVTAPVVVYTTDQAHSSVAKAALLAGYGWDNVRVVATDPWTRAMVAEDLALQIEADINAGRIPGAVVATAGTTGTTAFDPIDAIADVAARHGLWLHVDAAMAGSALLLPECRHLFNGIERADAVCWNPHKWMGTILDCSLMYVRDPHELTSVMATNPSYLRSSADGAVTQYRDMGIPLGRRFRALKLWFHLRVDGVEAIQARLREDLDNARWLADQVAAADHWEVVAPVQLQTVCVRHRPPGVDGEGLEQHTQDWVAALNRSGDAYLTPSQLDGAWMVRVSVGVEATARAHVEALWGLMRRAAESS